MDPWRLEMKPWRFCRPVVLDSHNFDPDPHLSEKLDPDPHEKVMQLKQCKLSMKTSEEKNT
jgi:hypothetical protein